MRCRSSSLFVRSKLASGVLATSVDLEALNESRNALQPAPDQLSLSKPNDEWIVAFRAYHVL